jgi:hypothetical protein
MTGPEHLDRVSKAGFRAHVEGATGPEAPMLLTERNRIKLPFTSSVQTAPLLGCRDFKDFVRIFLIFAGCPCQPGTFRM